MTWPASRCSRNASRACRGPSAAMSELPVAPLELRRLAQQATTTRDPVGHPVEQGVERHERIVEHRAHARAVAEQCVLRLPAGEPFGAPEPPRELTSEGGDAEHFRAGDV